MKNVSIKDFNEVCHILKRLLEMHSKNEFHNGEINYMALRLGVANKKYSPKIKTKK